MKNLILLLLLVINSNILGQLHFKNPDEVLNFIKKCIPSNPTIIESGGHFGEDTLRMKSVWPHANIHVFEPLPNSFRRMVKATQDLQGVTCYQYALTNHDGTSNFYINIPNNAASSIGAPVEWNQHEFNLVPIQVPGITLDTWAQEYNISHVDFMWLDMEGHELYALQHALHILHTVSAIYTEISFIPIRKNGCLHADLKTFLELNGFCEVWHSKSDGRIADALFIKKDLILQLQ